MVSQVEKRGGGRWREGLSVCEAVSMESMGNTVVHFVKFKPSQSTLLQSIKKDMINTKTKLHNTYD